MLTADSVEKNFGGARVLRGASLTVPEGSIVGLVGPNGSGKTTLLNCLSGFLRPDGGSIEFKGQRLDRLPDWKVSRLGVRRTFQSPAQPMKMTVLESMLSGAHLPIGVSPVRGLLQPRKRRVEEREALDRAHDLLSFLKLSDKVDHAAGRLSGGQQKLLSLGIALMTEPEVLLLDEPTAGVAPPLRRTLVERLKQINARGTTILVIEHDMHFIGSLCGLVHVLDKGEVIASCTPKALKDNPRVVEAYLGTPRSSRAAVVGKIGGAA